MSENTNDVETTSNKEAIVVEKLTMCTRMVDTCIDKALGYIGNHPWKKWLDVANRYIGLFLPGVIAAAGLLATLFYLIAVIKYDASVSELTMVVAILIGTMFALHLAPKAIKLVLSVVEKSEPEVIRPELLYIFKVVLGLGGILTAIYLTLQFESDLIPLILITVGVAVLSIITCTCPETVGIKAAHPSNAVEEFVSILLFPLRIVLSLFSILMGVATVGLLVYGFVVLCQKNGGMQPAIMVWITAIGVPFLVPLASYVAVLVFNFVLDLYRALVSVPRKLDEVRKAIEEKK